MQPAPQRIVAIDVLRGTALLGILLLNILAFGLPAAAYDNPTVDGATSGLNLLTYQASWLFFEGAMRAIFCMLFGAGIVLFTQDIPAPALPYYRRTVLLCIFGLVDMFVLLWLGDVLYAYGLAGLALYPFRHLAPRRLCIMSATLVLLMIAAQLVNLADLRAGSDEFVRLQAEHMPTAQAVADEIAMRQRGYLANFEQFAATALTIATLETFRSGLWDALAMMLLGMALLKWGVLTGGWSKRRYYGLAAAGYTIGLSINAAELHLATASEFALDWTSPHFTPTYHIGRLGMALGHMALVMLWCRSGHARRLQRALADVGRMALTNYLLQSLLGLMLFTGAGLALFGELQRTSLYLLVPCIWLLQVAFSVCWLDRFRVGPLEWLWRWLTYGTPPPMLLKGPLSSRSAP